MNNGEVDVKKLDAFIKANRRRFEDELSSLVEIPTVSMDPAYRLDIERGADAAVRILRDAGAKAEKVPTAGNPIVVGDFYQSAAAPTVTIYNHLDVQPADPAEWNYTPFAFVRRDDTYGGRGTTDDKGPAMTALAAVRYALEQAIPINVRFVWELEEEIGSPSFEGFLAERASRMLTDSVLVSDTIWISRQRPAVAYALRGLVSAVLTLETGKKDVHSGLVGGLARNPIGELCEVISRCYDARTGRVKIPGFYDRVRRPTKKEIESFARSGFKVDAFKSAHELRSLRKVAAREAPQRIWTTPTFEVHGIKGGYQGPGVKTVVPARAEAKVSMRLVPEMRPAEIFEKLRRFVKKLHPEVEVTLDSQMEPYLGEFSGPYPDAARESLRFGFGKEPAFVREGGSIGAVLAMQKHWHCPIILMGLSLPEHGYHCPNETYDWGQASGGIRTFAKYFERISGLF